MKERPILFSVPMVKAILDGRKTVTRRVVKPQPTEGGLEWATACGGDFAAWQDPLLLLDEHSEDGGPCQRKCPYGRIGEKLWVRETWMDLLGTGIERKTGDHGRYAYAADTPPGSYGDDQRKAYGLKWRPSIHMPRAASRITLEVTGVRVERLQDISETDAVAEGARPTLAPLDTVRLGAVGTAKEGFRQIWESINGPGSWDANPWVWVVEFKRVEGEKT